jgi:3',5'-cyclic-AMP phosphodiesterase
MAIRFAQISDLHILKSPELSFNGIKTLDSFKLVIDDIAKHHTHSLDFLLFTGDISEDGSMESYQLFDSIVKPLGIKYYWIPGNHDDCEVMSAAEKVLGVSRDKIFEYQGVRFILLNSVVKGQSYGYLQPNTIDLLKDTLDHPNNGCDIVVLHHNPVDTEMQWSNDIKLKGSEEFLNFLVEYPSVKAILNGHTHSSRVDFWEHITCITAPATSFQIHLAEDLDGFALLPDSLPGYRILEADAKKGITKIQEFYVNYPIQPTKDKYPK